MLDSGPQKVDVHGTLLPVAPLLERGSAIAVDLIVAVAGASLACWALSLALPDGDIPSPPR